MVDYVVATCPTCGYFEDSTCIFGCTGQYQVLSPGEEGFQDNNFELGVGRSTSVPGVLLLVVLA